jgi:hypothetical protein
MTEQRNAPRHRCFFRAFVYLDGGGVAIDCIVRELSDIGARLKFPKALVFTEFLDLHIPVKGQSFHSRVQWQEGDEIGVAFHVATSTHAPEVGLDRRVDRLEAEIAMLRQVIKHLQKNVGQKAEAA